MQKLNGKYKVLKWSGLDGMEVLRIPYNFIWCYTFREYPSKYHVKFKTENHEINFNIPVDVFKEINNWLKEYDLNS